MQIKEKIKNLDSYQKVVNSDIFETLKHSQYYFIAQIVTTGISFLTIPIFTRFLSQEDYGIVSVFSALLSVFLIVLTLNTHSAVTRYYFEDNSKFDEYLGSTLIFTYLIFLFNAILYLLFFKQIKNFVKLPDPLPLFLLPLVGITIITKIYLQILYSKRKSKEAATINILKGFLTILLAVIFVVNLSENRYLSKIWAQIIITAIFAVYMLYQILKNSKFVLKWKYIKYTMKFTLPLIPYALSGVILGVFDRIFMNYEIDPATAGIYSLGYNIALLISMAIGATQTALMPDFFNFLNNEEYQRLDLLINRINGIITISALVLILFSPEIVLILVDKKFHESLTVIPIIVIGYIFFGISRIYGRYIGYSKKTIYSSIVMVSSGFVNIIFNVIFIPVYGYIAAAYTTAISYFTLFLFTWFVVKFILKMKITSLWIAWKPVLIFFVFLGIYNGLLPFIDNLIIGILVKLILIGLFGVLIYYKEINIIIGSSSN